MVANISTADTVPAKSFIPSRWRDVLEDPASPHAIRARSHRQALQEADAYRHFSVVKGVNVYEACGWTWDSLYRSNWREVVGLLPAKVIFAKSIPNALEHCGDFSLHAFDAGWRGCGPLGAGAMTEVGARSEQPRDEVRRICVVSRRNIGREAYQTALYEAEDVLAGSADVDLLEFDADRGFEVKDRWLRRLVFRGLSPAIGVLNPGVRKVRLARDYDMLVIMCQSIWDLLYVGAIEGISDRCKTSVCWISELWATDIAKYPQLLRQLDRFDHVCLSSQGSVVPLARHLGRPCRLVPTGTDTLRFSPYPRLPHRSIDVLSIGRRWDGVHRELLRGAREHDWFYSYDTCRGMASVPFIDHAQHRDLIANTARRSRYFMVSPGKMDLPGETGGQVEVGYRYFEGAASGAVMIGQAADCELFRELFPWPDAVIEIKPDGSDVLTAIAKLNASPEIAAAMGRRNAVHSLERHDWIHRWIDIVNLAGMLPSRGMTDRASKLAVIAKEAQRVPVECVSLH